MKIEKNFDELNNIVEKLEQGNLSLEENVKLFESGTSLLKECYEELNSQKAKVVKLKEEMGEIIEEKM